MVRSSYIGTHLMGVIPEEEDQEEEEEGDDEEGEV